MAGDKVDADKDGASGQTPMPASTKATDQQSSSSLQRYFGYVLFFSFLIYVQVTCFVCSILILLGYSVSQGSSTAHYLSILRTKFATTQKSQKIMDDSKRPVVYLPNHRSWGDFWTDCALLGGTSFVARRLVAVAVPASALYGILEGRVWLFNRSIKHPGGTTAWFASFYTRCHAIANDKGCSFYPEGTRSTKPHSLPLKPGGLAVIYKLGWPAQIVISTNKEHVTDEKRFRVGFGCTVVSSVSAPLVPSDYPTSDEFINAVKTTWDETWADAYSETKPVLRETALLPGAHLRPSGFILGLPRLNALRAVILSAVLPILWYNFRS
eukprot:TRINITY_DN7219_c1_g1_i1.p1 TRINITY_DN7219_c1_g1~~TRINITY_DN7219_c1_g1_i1.p1  ORF type:complete len:355 (+),score=34.43 TRINITY_DN7219_c1_g1_i1:93-1067(+)